MMSKKWVLMAFILLCLVQIALITFLIFKKEIILNSGKAYRFQVRPVDPRDLFVGRYVALGIIASGFELVPSKSNEDNWENLLVRAQNGLIIVPYQKFDYKERVYALVAVHSNGFAVITNLSKEKPMTSEYFTTKINYTSPAKGITNRQNQHVIGVDLKFPFDRFYLNEEDAPLAEKVYRELSANSEKMDRVYITVKIKDGQAVLDRFYIDDMTVSEYLKTLKKNNK